MAARAVIAHQIPGRVRLRIPDKREDAAYFGQLIDELSHAEGVQKVKVNPTTGSVVREFTDGLGSIVQRARARDLFLIEAMEAERPLPVSPGTNTKPVNLVSGRQIDSMFMLGSALGAAGVVQIIRGKILGPALSLFWYAQQAFRQSGDSINTR